MTARPDDLEPCPNCGRLEGIFPDFGVSPYGLTCDFCTWQGEPVCAADDPPDEAIREWNRECRLIARARAMGIPVRPEAGVWRADRMREGW